MKIALSTEIKTFNNIALVDENKTKLTLRSVIINALLATYDEERNLSGEEKLARYVLATRIHNKEEDEFSPEELVLIKRLVGRAYGTNVVGPVYILLNG